MNDPTLVIGLVFNLVMLGLITYWAGYQTVRMIKALQEIRASRQHARVCDEAPDLRHRDSLGKSGMRVLNSHPGGRHSGRRV
jgi:hypothetical protein